MLRMITTDHGTGHVVAERVWIPARIDEQIAGDPLHGPSSPSRYSDLPIQSATTLMSKPTLIDATRIPWYRVNGTQRGE